MPKIALLKYLKKNNERQEISYTCLDLTDEDTKLNLYGYDRMRVRGERRADVQLKTLFSLIITYDEPDAIHMKYTFRKFVSIMTILIHTAYMYVMLVYTCCTGQ